MLAFYISYEKYFLIILRITVLIGYIYLGDPCYCSASDALTAIVSTVTSDFSTSMADSFISDLNSAIDGSYENSDYPDQETASEALRADVDEYIQEKDSSSSAGQSRDTEQMDNSRIDALEGMKDDYNNGRIY